MERPHEESIGSENSTRDAGHGEACAGGSVGWRSVDRVRCGVGAWCRVGSLSGVGSRGRRFAVGCAYCIGKGRRWLKKTEASARGQVNKGFLLVVMLEAAGVGGVIAAAQKLGRLEMLSAWIGIGLRFLGLAKVFRVAAYYVTGVGMTLWCVAVWVSLRGERMDIAACLGIGVILWATAAFNLYGAVKEIS